MSESLFRFEKKRISLKPFGGAPRFWLGIFSALKKSGPIEAALVENFPFSYRPFFSALKKSGPIEAPESSRRRESSRLFRFEKNGPH
ncbi:MAG: hypothetical protein RML57_04255 [Acidobacteriota bacterium]|nr:hypothetical protein [Acidobacteriota bacterium]